MVRIISGYGPWHKRFNWRRFWWQNGRWVFYREPESSIAGRHKVTWMVWQWDYNNEYEKAQKRGML